MPIPLLLSSIAYRPEIDGLRAIAVLSVVFFHVTPQWIPGGFTGVDVFFVISGFLISAIIAKQIQAGTFTFKQFWLRRVRRLFPALAAVLLATLTAGYFIIFGEQWRSLGAQTNSVLLLGGNFQMWRLANDYWGQSAHDIPLLHTWSLGIEEQFYLLYPIFLLFLFKTPRAKILIVLTLLLGASLALSVHATLKTPAAAFYLLPSRAWELLSGCILGLFVTWNPGYLSNLKAAPVFALSGIAAVIASFFLIRETSHFPGFWAVLPVGGTAAVIAFSREGAQRSFVEHSLAFGPLNYIGRISYSLYLWHWPVLVYSQWYGIGAAWVIAASIAAASLSYHFLEVPFRGSFRLEKYVFAAYALLFILATSVQFSALRSQGLAEEISFIDAPGVSTRGWEFDTKSKIPEGGILINCGPGESPRLVVIGSSHARMLSKPFVGFAAEHNLRIGLLGAANLPISDLSSELARKRLDYFEEWRPEVAFIAGRWEAEVATPNFEENFRAALVKLTASCPTCFVLAQVPLIQTNERSGKNLKKFLAIEHRRAGRFPDLLENPSYLAANQKVRSIVTSLDDSDGLRFVELGEELRKDGKILAIHGGRMFYDDHNHLNDAGSQLVFDDGIRPLLEQLLSDGVITKGDR